jgi:hypothetical protein
VKCIGLAAAAFIAILAGMETSSASTVTVSSLAAFNAQTTGAVTTGFDSVTGLIFPNDPPCPGSGACFAGFNPVILDHGITLSTTPGDHVNVNSAGYYGAGDLTHQYAVNSETHFVTINLPSAVTAFGLDFGSLFDATTANFLLSNGFAENNVATLGSLQTQFIGFISDTAFNTITLTVPDDKSFVVADVTTAVATTPIPATLPLLMTALGGLGFVGYRRRRKAALT